MKIHQAFIFAQVLITALEKAKSGSLFGCKAQQTDRM